MGPLLLLEDVGAVYHTSSDNNEPKSKDPACFAPPFCKQGDLFLSQSTAICQHLGIQYGVAGEPSQAGVMMRTLCNAEDFWGESYRPTKGGKDPAAGKAFAESDRFNKWLVTLQGPPRGSDGPSSEDKECRLFSLNAAGQIPDEL